MEYDGIVSQDSPRRLLLKLARPGKPAQLAASEARFYRHLAPRLTHLRLARCFGDGEHHGVRFLLLEDLSKSHTARPWPLPLAEPHCHAAVEALAAVHAFGRLNALKLPPPGAGKTPQAILEQQALRYQRFTRAFGDILDEGERAAFTAVIRSTGEPWRALVERRDLTLIHGDAHCGNVLHPRASGESEVVLIDWQFWSHDLGARDLAYLMALHWRPEQRARLERPLLERYHRRLVELGVGDCTWERCWNDYRLCVVRNLFVPLMLWERGLPASRWWPLLQCALPAYADLDCGELLQAG